jgi:hypothetical protein
MVSQNVMIYSYMFKIYVKTYSGKELALKILFEMVFFNACCDIEVVTWAYMFISYHTLNNVNFQRVLSSSK